MILKPEPRRDRRKSRLKKSLWPALAIFFFFSKPFPLGAEASSLLFLPKEPLFDRLIGDPREDQSSLTAQLETQRLDGSIAATLEFLQWVPGDATRWGWGVEGDSFVEVEYEKYNPDSVAMSGHFLLFPVKVSDWYLGTYLSESSGLFSSRLEYLHVNSNLGDGLFKIQASSDYFKESFRYTASFQISDEFRLYAGAGYDVLGAPAEPPFFLHCGMELFSDSFPFVFGTLGRGYFTYDFKAMQQTGGILNQNFAVGFQWRWEKDSHQSIRLGLVYYNGNNEYGQFDQQNDNHWSLGLFFDP